MALLKTKVVTSFLLVLLSALDTRGQTSCNMRDGQYKYCQCEMSDGSGTIDLSPYGNENGDPEFTVKDSSGIPPQEYEYYVNLCFAVSKGCTQAAGCQHRPSDDQHWSIGRYTTANFTIVNTDVVLWFGNGDGNRIMEIILKCDRNLPITSPLFKYDGEETKPFVYGFTLTSPCACPGVCGSGSSSEKKSDPGVVGIVLIVLAFVAFVTYFIVGAVILRVRYHKSGTDLIINKQFWKDFPYLVKDGFVFTFSPLYNLIRGRAGGHYDSLK